MGRPSVLPADKKLGLVVRVMSGELTAAEAAREVGVSEQSVSNWRRQFLEGGRNGLAGDGGKGAEEASRIAELTKENAALKATIGELYMELRRSGRSVAGRPPQFRGRVGPGRLVN